MKIKYVIFFTFLRHLLVVIHDVGLGAKFFREIGIKIPAGGGKREDHKKESNK